MSRPRPLLALAVLALLAALSCLTAVGAATSAQARVSPGNAALNWAETHALGRPYQYGAAGPDAYDCSGLVSTSILRATGIWIGRSTGEILATSGHGHLTRVPVTSAPRGALLFFGTGHVELNTIWHHTSFGAHHSGTTAGWRKWSAGYAPTAAYIISR